MKNKRRFWIEASIAGLILAIALSITVPLFLKAQKAAHRRKVEQTVEQLAQLFKETPLTQTHLSRYALNFRTETVTRFIQDKRIITSSSKPIEVAFQWSRYWLVLDHIIEYHPEISNPNIDEEVNYFIDVYDESLFIVYAWMGATQLDTGSVYLNNEPVFRPEINSLGYYEANCLVPLYGAESGWDEPGVVYHDSFQTGWRKQPTFFEAEQQP